MPSSVSICFNRTLVELKGCGLDCFSSAGSFNRTLVELKGQRALCEAPARIALIVP